MTGTIDKRIVEMAFENSQFEKGVGNSLNTIDRLKKSLNFSQQEKAFDGISNAAGRVHLGGIAEGVNNIASRFSALGIIGITALANLTNSAIEAGKRIVNALVIDPIKTGLNEYETKLNSVQTILANTQKEGTNLETVTKALNDLNTYSDKTIYNFQQMARNVGTFTAAGVKLDTSVAAIKGIANLAAISGSNAEQASTAMYQLSQALSTGTVRLMDWNSVVNAGMGGQVFQDALVETARVHGIAVDQIIKDEGSFRNSLQRGWLTSEVLAETLQKFTGDLNEDQLRTMGYSEEQIASIIKLGKTANDAATKVKTFSQLFDTLKEAAQSGWAQTWEIIIGNFDEAKSFLTDLNNWFGAILQNSAKARNDLLQGWKDLGGRAAALQILQNVLNGIVGLLNPIKLAFKDIFPPITAQRLFEITDGIRKLTEHFKMGEATAEKIRRAFKGVFAIFDIGRMAVVAIAKEFGRLLGFLSPVPGGFLDIVAAIGDYLVKIRDSIKTNQTFTKIMKTIGDVLLGIAGIVKIGLDALLKAVDRFKLINKTQGFMAAFVESIKTFFSFFKTLDFSVFSGFVERIMARFAPIKKIGEFFKTAFGGVAKSADPFTSKLGEIASHVREAIGKFVLSILDKLSKVDFSKFSFNKMFDTLNKGLIAALLLAITSFVKNGTGIFKSIVQVFQGVGNFAENANGILASLKTVLDGVKGTFVAWQQQIRAGILLKIAGAIAILSVSLIALSLVDSEKLTGALAAITLLFANLFGAMATYEKVAGTGGMPAMAKGVIGLVGLATAVLLLSGALVNVAQVDTKDLVKGVIAITTLTAVLVATSIALSRNAPTMIKGTGSLILFSIALKMMIKPIKDLGAMDPGKLATGLVGLAALLAEIGVFMRTMNFKGSSLDDIIAIFILTAAISDLTGVVEKFATIESSKLLQGLSTMAVLLAELMAFSKISANGGNFLLTASGMLVLSGAMLVLSNVLDKLGTMSWEELGTALVGMAGALGILALALNLMTGGIAGAAALLVAAGAMVILVPPLLALGKMDLKAIGLALLALAGTFTVLGLAGTILTPMIPTLLLLAVAMAGLGVAAFAVGAGVLAFSAGMAALAVTGAAGGAALAGILVTLAALVPMLAIAAAKGLIAFVATIKTGVPQLYEAGKAIMLGFLKSITSTIPAAVDVILGFLVTLQEKFAERIPQLVETGNQILLGFLNGVKENIGQVTDVSIDIMTTFIKTIADRLPELQQAGWDLIIGWIDAMADAAQQNIPRLMDSTRKLGLAIVKGVLQGIVTGNAELLKTVENLALAVLAKFKAALGIHSPSKAFFDATKMIAKGIIMSFGRFGPAAVNSAGKLGDDIVDSFASVGEKVQSFVGFKMDVDPTVRPVVDLTGINDGLAQMEELFAGTPFSAKAMLAATANISGSMASKSQVFPEGPTSTKGTVNGPQQVSFVQNNYSPKELSRIDIYRQTQNQLLKLKGAGGHV